MRPVASQQTIVRRLPLGLARGLVSRLLPALALALLLGACSSPTSAPAAGEVACTCGTHEARIHGCHHPACESGTGNPDNPQCRCASLAPVAPATKGN